MRKQSLPTFAWNIRENRIGHSRGTPHAHASCQDYFSSDRNISCMSVVPHKVEKVRLQFKFVHAYAIIRLGGGAVSKLTPLWHRFLYKKVQFLSFRIIVTQHKAEYKNDLFCSHQCLICFLQGRSQIVPTASRWWFHLKQCVKTVKTSNRFKQEGFCPEKSLA